MAPALKKLLEDFYLSIPHEKLSGTYVEGKAIFADQNFRLDCQGVTTVTENEPLQYNLQVQVNDGAATTALRGMAKRPKGQGSTFGFVLFPVKDPWEPEKIVNELVKSGRVFNEGQEKKVLENLEAQNKQSKET